MSLDSTLQRLRADPWRLQNGFSPEIAQANERMFQAATDEEREDILRKWLAQWQPCIFGRLAAKQGLLAFCFLTEQDLVAGEEHIHSKIQSARLRWIRQTYNGHRSGFVIVLISRSLAYAVPDDMLLAIAKRISSLYLLRDIEPGGIYHETVFLEKPDDRRITWEWLAGVNYFCASADGRWWRDHRIPGGMALSINSVGHMAKSGALVSSMQELDTLLGIPAETDINIKVDSLGKALALAMHTIHLASEGVSGKATLLTPANLDEQRATSIPPFLAAKSCRQYLGYYHTDVTLPTEYFQPDVVRPDHITAQSLDFTYLFERSPHNPDFILMGEGRRIRQDDSGEDLSLKVRRVTPRAIDIDSSSLLSKALALD